MSLVRWSLRRRRAKVRPGMPGSTQSSSTRSGRESRTSASACGTSPAHITLYPACCRLAASRSRTATSSSTTRMEPPLAPPVCAGAAILGGPARKDYRRALISQSRHIGSRVVAHRQAVDGGLVEQQLDHPEKHAVGRSADVEHPFADALVGHAKVTGKRQQTPYYRGSSVQCTRLYAHCFHLVGAAWRTSRPPAIIGSSIRL